MHRGPILPGMVNDTSMEDQLFYPMFVSLDGRVCLVVGGGSVGERKVRSLLQCRATVRLVAERLSPWIEEQARSGAIEHVGLHFEPQHMDGADLVFAVTNDRDLNRRMAEEAQRRRLWCNMATDPDRGSFIVPSVFRRGPLTVAFSTGGLSPALAKGIREQFEHQFDVNWELFMRLLGRLRQAVQRKGLDTEENQKIFRDLAALPVPAWLASQEQERVLPALQAICGNHLSSEELTRIWEELCNLSYSPSQPFATAAVRSDT
ncbi:MAG: bifunctional precorrin-2 dehydrogenase/sirohydrochlorin ferrochelatase [Syntrophobacteraceae bacterium]